MPSLSPGRSRSTAGDAAAADRGRLRPAPARPRAGHPQARPCPRLRRTRSASASRAAWRRRKARMPATAAAASRNSRTITGPRIAPAAWRRIAGRSGLGRGRIAERGDETCGMATFGRGGDRRALHADPAGQRPVAGRDGPRLGGWRPGADRVPRPGRRGGAHHRRARPRSARVRTADPRARTRFEGRLVRGRQDRPRAQGCDRRGPGLQPLDQYPADSPPAARASGPRRRSRPPGCASRN